MNNCHNNSTKYSIFVEYRLTLFRMNVPFSTQRQSLGPVALILVSALRKRWFKVGALTLKNFTVPKQPFPKWLFPLFKLMQKLGLQYEIIVVPFLHRQNKIEK